jgi:Uma2 family endonuclease
MTIEIRTGITAEQYFQLPEYAAHDNIQLIDGEVIIGMPPIPRHQAAVVETIFVFKQHSTEQGGRVYSAPIEVYLDTHNVFEPDVLYLAPDTRCVVEAKRLVGPPDLVVEVLSPSTAKQDREKKFRAYEAHGVREYWIVDPANLTIEVWVLRNGLLDKIGTFVPGDTFESLVLSNRVIAVKDILAE